MSNTLDQHAAALTRKFARAAYAQHGESFATAAELEMILADPHFYGYDLFSREFERAGLRWDRWNGWTRIAKRQRKAARKTMQQPYNYAARYRSDAFTVIAVMADDRRTMTKLAWRWGSHIGMASQARTYNAEAKATGFYLP